MAKTREVTAGVRVGGQIQVKKFDIQAEYEYQASKVITLEEGDDENQIIDDTLDEIKKKLLEPKRQQDFEDLWKQRLSNEKAKKLGDARG